MASIYADIREVLGVSTVNLIWRHLATIDSALPWTWETLRPIYTSGILERAAAELRRPPSLPALAAISTDDAVRAAADRSVFAAVDATLRQYDRSNPVNLLALRSLLCWLDGDRSPPGEPVAGETPVPISVPPKLAPLIPHQSLSPHLRMLARRLTALGSDDPGEVVNAGVPRHLANWPGVFELMVNRVEPHEDAFRDSIREVEQQAVGFARVFTGELRPSTRPARSDQFYDAIRPFTSSALIANFIPKVRAMRIVIADLLDQDIEG